MVEYRLVIYNLSLFPVLKPEAKSPKGGAINMAKITGKYEVLYIIDPTLGEEGAAEYHFLGAELRPDDLGDLPHPVPEHLQAVSGKPEISPVFHPLKGQAEPLF